MTPQKYSSLLAKALDSGVTTSGAFIDNDDYLDYVDELRRSWSTNQPKIPNYKQWVEMYPELKDDFGLLIMEKEDEKNALIDNVRKRLKNIDLIKTEDWKLILTEKIRCNEGEIIEELGKQIMKLRFAITTKNNLDNSLSENDIQTARDYPVEDLLDTKKVNKMWCCPFHEENTPSFYIYPDNGWHCFGCQAHGKGAIDFVLKKNKDMSFVEAVKYLIGK